MSNEGRELTVFRVRTFGLYKVIDFFVCSCFVHLRKPDKDIWRIALDIACADADKVVYIDDRPLFVDVAEGLGLKGIVHTGLAPTKAAAGRLGLLYEKEVRSAT